MTQKPFSSAPSFPSGGETPDTYGTPGEQGLAEHAKQKAIETAGQAKEQLGGALDAGKERAVEGLGGVAQALRDTTRQMRDQEHGELAPYVDRAADQLDRLSGYLRSRTVGDMVGEVERFARREPAMFLGGAFALGLLAGRFLKASGGASRRNEGRYYEGEYLGRSRDEGIDEGWIPPGEQSYGSYAKPGMGERYERAASDIRPSYEEGMSGGSSGIAGQTGSPGMGTQSSLPGMGGQSASPGMGGQTSTPMPSGGSSSTGSGPLTGTTPSTMPGGGRISGGNRSV